MYGQEVAIRALMIGACVDEFLIGEDFLQDNAATLNFMTNEGTYCGKDGQLIVLPFNGIVRDSATACVL